MCVIVLGGAEESRKCCAWLRKSSAPRTPVSDGTGSTGSRRRPSCAIKPGRCCTWLWHCMSPCTKHPCLALHSVEGVSIRCSVPTGGAVVPCAGAQVEEVKMQCMRVRVCAGGVFRWCPHANTWWARAELAHVRPAPAKSSRRALCRNMTSIFISDMHSGVVAPTQDMDATDCQTESAAT